MLSREPTAQAVHVTALPEPGDTAQNPRPAGAAAPPRTSTAAEYWEKRYRENERSWSGDVNAALQREITGVAPGTALDLGAGEGGDALWLARYGWTVTAVDIAPSALAIGAAAQRPEDTITWVAADLADWEPPAQYDLVSSCFLHSFVELPRVKILRRAAEAVAPGGILLIVGHSGVPHWLAPEGDTAHADHAAHADQADPSAHEAELPDPDQMYELLFVGNDRLDPAEWSTLTSALVERSSAAPDGSARSLVDSVLTLRRLPASP